MASANVTLADVYEFEVDGTQKTATLNNAGGFLRNTHATEIAYVNVNAATCSVTQPVGAGGMTIKAGQVVALPAWCKSFTFKAGGTTYLQYSRHNPGA
jgi:hypothetical protein